MAAALLVLFGFSTGLCLVLTPVARTLAARLGFTDRPDGHRKTHARSVPLAGGVAVLVSGCCALSAAVLAPGPLGEILGRHGHALLGLLLAALVICGVGLVDDCRGLRAPAKFLGQLAAIAVVIYFGPAVQSIRLFGWNLELGFFAVPFTALWLLGTVNSLNLLDGMDGMLTSLGLILSAALAVMAALSGHWAAACVAVTLAGALLGFLRYNFPPATIFLGDAGSMVIGLVIGVLAVQSSLKGPAAIGLAVPVALLTLPFFDTTAAIVRRKLRGLSLSTPDRCHLHHCLLGRGLSSRGVLLWVALFSLVTGTGALASLAWQNEFYAVLSGLSVVGFLVITRLFGHVELVLVRDRLLAGTRFIWQASTDGKQDQADPPPDSPWKGLWDRLLADAGRLNLKIIRLDAKGPTLLQGCRARWARLDERTRDAGLWRAEIPLEIRGEDVGKLEVVGQRDQELILERITAVMKLVQAYEVRESFQPTLTGTTPVTGMSRPAFAAKPGPVFSE